MSIKAAMRYVKHRITELPDAGVTFEAECLHCDWKAAPADTPGRGCGVREPHGPGRSFRVPTHPHVVREGVRAE